MVTGAAKPAGPDYTKDEAYQAHCRAEYQTWLNQQESEYVYEKYGLGTKQKVNLFIRGVLLGFGLCLIAAPWAEKAVIINSPGNINIWNGVLMIVGAACVAIVIYWNQLGGK